MSAHDDLDLWLSVTIVPHVASYECPEDHYAEFVREVMVTLYRHVTVDECEAVGAPVENDEEVVAELEGLIIRQRRFEDGVDVRFMADAHSQSAADACSYLLRASGDDGYTFYRRFDADPHYSNVLLIERLAWAPEWEAPRTREMLREFVRRAVQQFDVELVLIERGEVKGDFSEHFEGFFKTLAEDAPFLIYSKAHRWPATPKAPELQVTSPGGTA